MARTDLPRPARRLARWVVLAAVFGVAAVGVGLDLPSGPVARALTTTPTPTPPAATDPAVPTPPDATVTLLSGDQVLLSGGTSVRQIVPPGGLPVTAYSRLLGGHAGGQVVPNRVLPLVGELLDERLLDVDELVRTGHVDGRGPLDLLVTHDDEASVPPGLELVEVLDAQTWLLRSEVVDRPVVGRWLAAAAHDPAALRGVVRIAPAWVPDEVPSQPGRPDVGAAGNLDLVPLTFQVTPRGPDAELAGRLHLYTPATGRLVWSWPVDTERTTIETEVRPGAYGVVVIFEQEVDGARSLVHVSDPAVIVDRATTVHLDGADANEVTVASAEGTRPTEGIIATNLRTTDDPETAIIAMSLADPDGLRLFAAPTEDGGDDHRLEVLLHAEIPGTTFHLRHSWQGAVPAADGLVITDDVLAEVANAMHADTVPRTYTLAIGNSSRWPPDPLVLSPSTVRVEARTRHRTMFGPGQGVRLDVTSDDLGVVAEREPADGFPVGRTEIGWFGSPVRPGTEPDEGLLQYYHRLWFQQLPFLDRGHAGTWRELGPTDHVTWSVRSGGYPAVEGTGPLFSDVFVDPGTMAEVVVATQRGGPGWLHSTATRSTWTFRTVEELVGWPAMVQVDVEPSTDLANVLAAPGTLRLHADVPGVTPPAFEALQIEAWLSADGSAWTTVPLDPIVDSRTTGDVRRPPGCADPCRPHLRVAVRGSDDSAYELVVADAFTVVGDPITPTLPPTGSRATGLAASGFALGVVGLLLLLAARRRLAGRERPTGDLGLPGRS